uniref:Nuclear receptor domain-containing protein n=1 Tax=Heterorhabditis bacteriophora TaxID=37862 RepID=A0A1I7XEM2_HETBA
MNKNPTPSTSHSQSTRGGKSKCQLRCAVCSDAVKHRNTCRACRLTECLRVGMNPRAVQSEPEFYKEHVDETINTRSAYLSLYLLNVIFESYNKYV